jgi:chitodextrinase
VEKSRVAKGRGASGRIAAGRARTTLARARRDTAPPSQPTGLRVAAATATSIALEWTPSPDGGGAVRYAVSLRPGGRAPLTSEPRQTFTGLRCGRSYTAAVAARDAAGNWSPTASLIVATAACVDREPPGPPRDVRQVAAGEQSVVLTWSPAVDTSGVVAYDVYRAGIRVAQTPATGHTITGLSCKTTYAIDVIAADAAGNRSQPARVYATTAACLDRTPPSQPLGLRIVARTGDSISIAWTPSRDDVAVTSYDLLRGSTRVGASTQPAATFVELGCGTEHSLGVAARDAAGNVSTPMHVRASTLPCPPPKPPPPAGDTRPPTTPTQLVVAAATSSTIVLAWGASSDDVAVAGYDVSRDGAPAGTTTLRSHTLAGLRCGTTYDVAVTARDGAGNRSAPARVFATTTACPDTQPPSPPGGVLVVGRTATSLTVSWSPAADETGVTGYYVYRAGSRAGATAQTTYTFTGLACGANHTLAVEAYDAAGNLSPRTTVLAGTSPCPDAQAPTAPGRPGVSAVTATSLTLSWAPASDNVGVAGYSVYRDGSPIGQTAATSMPLAGLSCGTSYVLAVEARDGAGNVSTRAQTTAGTAACPPPAAPPPPPPSPPAPAPPPPPPAAPPPPPPADGTVLFGGAFESGALAPWPGAQCANTGVSGSSSIGRGTITVQDEIVGEGNWAARFDLPAASVNQACEALIERPIGVGSDDYYALMVRIPSPWQEPSPAGWGLVIAQLNFQGIWGAPVLLAAHRDHLSLVLQSGLCADVTSSDPGCANTNGANGNLPPSHAIPAPLALDTWHQVIVHVRWATDTTGLVEAWHRPAGTGPWTKTVTISGYPTLQWTSSRGPTAITDSRTNDKIGAYRGHSTTPLTIWHDGFARTTSFATAAASLP